MTDVNLPWRFTNSGQFFKLYGVGEIGGGARLDYSYFQDALHDETI